MKRMLSLFWRTVYPVLAYWLLLGLATDVGMMLDPAAGVENGLLYTGVAALLALLLFGPLYRRERCFGGRDAEKLYLADYVSLCCVGAGFCLATNLIIGWTGFTSESYRQTEAVLYAPDIRLQVLLIGFLVPAAEELIFRGMNFRRLRENTQFWTAAVLSSLLFGWFHGNIVQGVYACFGGLLMAWGYERFRSLKAAYSIHASSNLFSLLISSDRIGTYLADNPVFQSILCITGFVLLLFGAIRIKAKGKVEI